MKISMPRSVLIIDNSLHFRTLLTDFLKGIDPALTVEHYDPERGRPSEAFPWNNYGLIIMEYNLGGNENGLEWLRLYKTSNDFPATIMLTSQDSEEVIISAFRYGVHDYLRKSGLTKRQMLEAVENAIRRHHKEANQASTQQLSVHLYNREKFYESLSHLSKHSLVILIEIKDFQAINTTYGMLIADKIAGFSSQTLAQFLSASAETTEIIRIGDSSIAILANNYPGPDQASAFGDQLCELFNSTSYQDDGKQIDFSMNFGGVYVDSDDVNSNTILHSLEIACCDARQSQGNTFALVNINADTKSAKAQSKRGEPNIIRDGLKEENIKLLYQPIMKVTTGHGNFGTQGLYQVYIHLLASSGRLLSAREFMPAIKEDNTALQNLDQWVIRSCLNQIRQQSGIRLLVMLTKASILSFEFIQWLNELADREEIPVLRDNLVFDINAQHFISYQKQGVALITALRKKYGIRFALSNITDNSILKTVLTKVTFEFVIISPFINGHSVPQTTIEGLINTAKELGCLSVVNKIENHASMALAMISKPDFISGYFIQPPQENIIGMELVDDRDKISG